MQTIKFDIILDSILNTLSIKQIELSKKYGLDKGKVSTDRKTGMTRLRMRAYKGFIEDNNISTAYFLTGEGDMFEKFVKRTTAPNGSPDYASIEKELRALSEKIVKTLGKLKGQITEYDYIKDNIPNRVTGWEGIEPDVIEGLRELLDK